MTMYRPMCRVCLTNNLPLSKLTIHNLTNVYEKLTNSVFNKDGYPLAMCYICMSVLSKCHRFMETAKESDKLLQQCFNKQTECSEYRARPLLNLNTSKVCMDTDIKSETVSVIKEEKTYDENETEAPFVVFKKPTAVTNNVEYTIETTHKTENVDYYDKSDSSSDDESKPFDNNSVSDDETRSSDNEGLTTENVLSDRFNICLVPQRPGCSFGNVTSIGTLPFMKIEEVEIEIEARGIQQMSTSSCDKTPTASFKNNDQCTTNSLQNNDKKFTCDICGSNYVNKRNLRRHKIFNHSTEKPYACDLCDYKSADKYAIAKHKIKHSGDKPFSCNECDFKTARKGVLTYHYKIKHTNEARNFSCDFCGKKFIRRCELKEHLSFHSKEKPFLCDLCGYKSSKKNVLFNHVKTVHNKERPYQCDLCKKSFSTKPNLKKHVLGHDDERPISCDKCSYKCKTTSHLKLHSVIHSDEKPFSCEFCNTKFKQKKTLKIHIRTHTGEKPYACHLCDFKCSQKSALNTHVKRHC